MLSGEAIQFARASRRPDDFAPSARFGNRRIGGAERSSARPARPSCPVTCGLPRCEDERLGRFRQALDAQGHLARRQLAALSSLELDREAAVYCFHSSSRDGIASACRGSRFSRSGLRSCAGPRPASWRCRASRSPAICSVTDLRLFRGRRACCSPRSPGRRYRSGSTTFDRTAMPYGPHLVEVRQQPVVVGLRDRVDLVIVAAGAVDRQAEKHLAGRRDDVVELVVAGLLCVGRFVVPQAEPIESRWR